MPTTHKEGNVSNHSIVTDERLAAVDLDALVGEALDGVDCSDAAAVETALADKRDDLPPELIDTFTARAKLTAAKRADEAGKPLRAVKVAPEAFDFDQPLPEPDWLLTGLLERATVNVCSGDTGAAKSIHWQDATVRIARGEEWLGRRTRRGRVLYVDEENPARVVHTRLPALGMTNADRERVRYYRRKGIRIGVDKWTQWAREECEDFAPDLVVIDTAMAATNAEASENDSVVALYTETLRPLAEDYGAAVVVLHHERKPGAQEKRNASFAMMGARQWAGQSDVHMTLTPVGKYTETPRDEGGFDTHKEFRFAVAKGRDGHDEREERTTVRSVKDERFRLVSMEVEYGGKVESATAEAGAAETILRILAADPDKARKRSEVAGAAGENPSDPGGTFKRAWKGLIDAGDLEPVGRAHKLSDQGRERAEALGMEF